MTSYIRPAPPPTFPGSILMFNPIQIYTPNTRDTYVLSLLPSQIHSTTTHSLLHPSVYIPLYFSAPIIDSTCSTPTSPMWSAKIFHRQQDSLRHHFPLTTLSTPSAHRDSPPHNHYPKHSPPLLWTPNSHPTFLPTNRPTELLRLKCFL